MTTRLIDMQYCDYCDEMIPVGTPVHQHPYRVTEHNEHLCHVPEGHAVRFSTELYCYGCWYNCAGEIMDDYHSDEFDNMWDAVDYEYGGVLGADGQVYSDADPGL